MPVYRELKQHKILLDTHIWYWLMSGDKKLKNSFISAVEHAAKQDSVLISAISVWEIGMLVAKGKIELEIDCMDWVNECLETQGMQLIAITPQIAIQSTNLPDEPHGDPADRILIATAHDCHAVLVTHDQKLLNYGQGNFINVFDPCH